MLSTLANNHFIFRLAYLADIIEQINKVNLKLQGRGRKSVDFIDTLSAFVEKFDNCERAAQTGHFVVFENLSTAAGDEVNADIASEVVQHLGGLREEFVLYFPEIINTNSDWVKKSIRCSSQEFCRLHARCTHPPSEWFWDQILFRN